MRVHFCFQLPMLKIGQGVWVSPKTVLFLVTLKLFKVSWLLLIFTHRCIINLWKQDPWLSCSSLYLVHLIRCLVCSRHSVNLCGKKKGRQRRTGIWSLIKKANIGWIPKSCPLWKMEVTFTSKNRYQSCIITDVKSKCKTQIPWPNSLFTWVAVNMEAGTWLAIWSSGLMHKALPLF